MSHLFNPFKTHEQQFYRDLSLQTVFFPHFEVSICADVALEGMLGEILNCEKSQVS